MRGARCFQLHDLRQPGIIPAYAGEHGYGHHRPHLQRGSSPRMRGSTIVQQVECFRQQDHPRVCEEHYRQPIRRSLRPGSSPRMRGAPANVCATWIAQGIVPAYAGSTRTSGSPSRIGRDHPRVCGEHWFMQPISRNFWGSSPRMRRAPAPLANRFDQMRIIPAYAGSTACRVLLLAASRDHPRVCGEHANEGTYDTNQKGSSPRMRGALRQ